jgi:hypothetical protein
MQYCGYIAGVMVLCCVGVAMTAEIASRGKERVIRPYDA